MAEATSTRQPLLWAALAFAAGISLGVHIWRPALWWFAAALVFLGAALHFRQSAGWPLGLAAVVALGAWSVQAHDSAKRVPDLSRFADGKEVVVTAHVVQDGLLRGLPPHQTQSLDLETETILREGTTTRVASGVRLNVYGGASGAENDETGADEDGSSSQLPHVFTCGQRLRFTVKLREPSNFRNPGAWDYRGYLLREGIVATGSVADRKVELLPGIAGSRWALWGSRARRSVLAQIHRLWPSESQAGLFDAMLIGERSFIGRDTNTAWQRTGIYHILVVSGMNVGILAAVMFGLLRRFRAGDVLATVLTIVLSAAYAYLAGLGAPVLRSVLMLTVFLIMRLLYRGRALLNAIGAAALVLLVVDPRALFDASFQLTFLSVVAIAGLAVPVLDRTSSPVRHGLRWLLQPSFDLSLSPRIVQFRLDLRMLTERAARLLPVRRKWAEGTVSAGFVASIRAGLALYDVVVVSAVAQMAMTLPMAFYFHRATVVGLAANTMAVPLTGVLMTSSALALALSYAWLPLAKIPAVIAGWSLSGIIWVVKVFGAMRISDLRLPTPSLAPCLAVAATFVVAMLLVRRRAPLALTGLLSLSAACLWLSVEPAQPQLDPGVLEITSIDVGQAESTLVATPQGRTLLVDAAGPLGPWHSEFDFGENVIAPYLWSRGISQLDAIMLTHAHSDHMGGMPGVIAIFHPRELWMGPNTESRALQELRKTATDYGVTIRQRSGGEQFEFGGARFEVLAPPRDWHPANKARNNDSLVIRTSYGSTSTLLTGDAEKQIESYLAGQHPAATLLKVGHNGSKTSTTPEFLTAVHPQYAVISVGAHNSFGHPRSEVLQRLSDAHVRTYRTDVNGAMTFLLDGRTVQASRAIEP